MQFLKDPKKFTKLGGRIPKGVLLVGPPGTGKTLLARAVAGEAGVPFFSISGSDFVEMFVGVGASRVRDLFEQGKKNAPCLIFIDEIDAVGRHRGAGMGGGHDEREQTLNQLLVEMDGFESNDGVILIAATNRPDVLDPALLRPGRFDRRVVVNKPDVLGRKQILEVHTRKTPLGPNVMLERVARGTPGFSGADLENLVNEAALIAAKFGKSVLEMDDFERAKDKVLMGAERKSMVISDEDKKITSLKALQGMIWKAGYQQGDFKGHVYPDAVECLKAWKAKGIDLYVYSSGSEQAQQLLFAYTDYGDLTPLFSGYFDTRIGHKRDPVSYKNIADKTGFPTGQLLFLSDIIEELDAAQSVGYKTAEINREAITDLFSEPVRAHDFYDIDTAFLKSE